MDATTIEPTALDDPALAMTDPTFDAEAALAELLSGEVDIDSEEGAALLARTGTSREEFERLRAVAESLEFRGVSKRAGEGREEIDTFDAAAVLRRAAAEGGGAAGDPSPATDAQSIDSRHQAELTRPSKTPLRPVIAAIALAAAAMLAFVMIRGSGDTPIDRPNDDGAVGTGPDDHATLNTDQPTDDLPQFVVDLAATQPSLTIPADLLKQHGDAVTIYLEEREGADRWSEVDAMQIGTPTTRIPLDWVMTLGDSSIESRLMWSAVGSEERSPSSLRFP